MPVRTLGAVDQAEARADAGTGPTGSHEIDALIDPYIAQALSALDGRAPLLAGMVRYHLGLVEADFAPATARTHAQSRGKRLRPAIALLSCAASGGSMATAAPLAAALELLHNFTLIHDDIQDKSATRRHRRTVWDRWGVEQAINAGDALFAVAHLPIVRLTELGVPGETIVRLIEAFNRMTIEIVEGQVLDLGFEGRSDVTPEDYLEMISGKTAAIVRYAAWAGAILANAPERTAANFGSFGLAVGIGYQVRDDSLGIWGSPNVTGKATADDIRRRKQSLPIVILRSSATAGDVERLTAIYAEDPIGESGVTAVLGLLERHDVSSDMETRAAGYHDAALRALATALGPRRSPAADALSGLVDHLSARQF